MLLDRKGQGRLPCAMVTSVRCKVPACIICLMASVMLLLQVPFCMAEDQPPILVATSAKPPLFSLGKSMTMESMLEEAFRRVGRPFRIVRPPSVRALSMLSEGTIDMEGLRLAGVEKTVAGIIWVDEPVTEYRFTGFVTQPGLAVRHWNDLASLRVGYLAGWRLFEKRIPASAHIVVAGELPLLFEMLQQGELDVVLHEETLASAWLDANNTGHGVRTLPEPLLVAPMYFYMNAGHAELAKQLKTAFRDMRREGWLPPVGTTPVSP